MNFRYLIRKRLARLLLFPALFLFIMAVNFYNYSGSPAYGTEADVQMMWLYLVGIIVVFSWVAFSMRRGWRKQYTQTQFLQSPATYTFSDSGIKIDSHASQGAATWETIDTLLVMKELAILTTRNLTVYLLDFRHIEAPATKADFLTLLQRHNILVK